MAVKKCPGCGAPVSGSVCTYCGTTWAEAQPPAEKSAPAEAAVQVIKPKRSVLDIILIFFGILWILTILGATFTLDEWWHPAMLVAALLTASPGIVLLLIGFRPKKQKVITKGKPTKP